MLGIGKKKDKKSAQKKGASANPANSASMKALKNGSVSLVDIIAPPSVEVDFKHTRVGDKYFRTFFVVDYPRQVAPNWLSTIIDYKETMNVSMYVFPVESKDVLTNLRRKIAEMEATIESDYKQGLEPDPKIQASLEDAIALREELARGLERFFQFGLYVTLVGNSPKELDEKSKQLTSLLAANLLIMKPATLQMEEGFKTTMPHGVDRLYITRNMDTSSVAMTFPFTSYEISQENGLLYGVNTINNSLVLIDRFSFENANEVVFGKSGSGKSFTVKLEILRQMMFETEILVIDPEDEYRDLCHALDGEYITFSKNSEVKLNPFALTADDTSEAQLGVKILSLHGLLKTMLGEMSPTQEAILDRALVLVYKQKGITPDPSTYKNEPPLLEDLYKTLLNMEEAEAKELSFRLEKYVKGGFAGLFNQHTNYDVSNQLTVFSIKQLEDAMRPIAMHVILDFIWGRVRTKMKRRLLIVDEAWYMMRHPDSASFLQGLAKRARKYYLGVTTLTQDIEDFLNNDYGRAIVSNSSIQILLKQGSAETEALAKAFNLSEGEKQFLLTAQVGEGLLFAGQNHITAQFIASQFEYELITSKPQDIMAREAQNNPTPPPPPPQQPDSPVGQADNASQAPGVENITKMFENEQPKPSNSGQNPDQEKQVEPVQNTASQQQAGASAIQGNGSTTSYEPLDASQAPSNVTPAASQEAAAPHQMDQPDVRQEAAQQQGQNPTSNNTGGMGQNVPVAAQQSNGFVEPSASELYGSVASSAQSAPPSPQAPQPKSSSAPSSTQTQTTQYVKTTGFSRNQAPSSSYFNSPRPQSSPSSQPGGSAPGKGAPRGQS